MTLGNSMTNEELHALKQQLLDQQTGLMNSQSLGQAATDTVILDQSSVGRVSRIDAMQSQSMAIETARLRQQQLRQITLALARIASADYGYCDGCDIEIDLKRLAISPAANYCVSCASQRE